MAACCIGNDANGNFRGVAENIAMSHPTTGDNGMGNNNTTGAWLAAAEQIRLFNQGGGPAWNTLDTDIRIVVARPFIECAWPLTNRARSRLPTTLTSPDCGARAGT